MKDIVFLSVDSSDVLGFSIKQDVLDTLRLKWKDLIEIEIFREYKGRASFVLLRKIRKFGSSFGVSIPKKLVKELNFKKDESLQVDFRKPA
ncbi:unnamed protein product [marine sediment metagenome]|uniref:SpoVT-AbrB domain-containing protein n=1 Tax=marine sediment metagenome TaxID=412755 RepID=X1USS2_9ZZZZ